MHRRHVPIPALLLTLAALVCVAIGAWLLWGGALPRRATGVSNSAAQRGTAFDAPPPRAADSYARITAAVAPREDQVDLALRYKGLRPEQAQVSCAALADLPVGSERPFSLINQDARARFDARARLLYKNANVYMWAQISPERVTLDTEKLRQAADSFEREVYPAVRAAFGSEAKPGVDCDARIHIVHVTGIGATVGGYFAAVDAQPKAVRSDSNEGQIYVMHAAPTMNGSDPGSRAYMATLAHEFQHMVASNNVHATELWLEEGAAQLAERLTGYGPNPNTVSAFAAAPDTQLNAWSEGSAGANTAHYGASYMFWSYLFDRFGESVVSRLLKHPQRSIDGLMRVLADNGARDDATGGALSFETLFADWTLANLNGRSDIIDGRHSYRSIDPPEMALQGQFGERDLPLDIDDALPQFAAHYVEIRAKRGADLNLTLRGSRTVGLLPAPTDERADASNPFWWSGRGDASNPRLTRAVDLRTVKQATLTFKALYRFENGYDYGYVSASTDGGRTWSTLRTQTCVTDNPQNANLGCGWTGSSNATSSGAPRWVEERADLSAYVGQQILVRFECVSDAGTTREGLAIDDIGIPEIGLRDDASTDEGWTSEGFARVSNALPQRWSVRALVHRQDDGVDIREIAIDPATGVGSLRIPAAEGARGVVLIISPVTRFTTEPAFYTLAARAP
jgi:hypothetical protein